MRDAIKYFEEITASKNFEYFLPQNIAQKGSQIVIFTAPPGAGKTSCINAVLKFNFYLSEIFKRYNLLSPKLIYVPGTTTRPLRKGELHGFDFHFVSEKQFFKILKNKEFLLYFTSYPYLYAVDGKDIERRLEIADKYSIFIYNLNAFQVEKLKRKFLRKPKVIFLNAPSLKELEKRKYKRGGLSKEEIEYRRRMARLEIKKGREIADIKIINRDFIKTIEKILSFLFFQMLVPHLKSSLFYQQKIWQEIKKSLYYNRKEIIQIIKK